MYRPTGLGLVLACLALPALGAPASAALEAFFGQYQGTGIANSGGAMSARDLNVTIAPYENGFRLDWVTVTRKSSGRIKRKNYSINFVPARKPNLFASAMRNNMFGKPVPLDPLKGEPFVWAAITGRTLTVYALLITEDYGYEIQVYKRRLTAGGMALEFSRFRDGRRLRDVSGTLKRVGN